MSQRQESSISISSSSSRSKSVEDGAKIVKLNSFERFMCRMNAPSIATVTLFQGDADVASKFILDRFIETVEANPWLCGKICWQNNRDLTMHYPVSPPTQVEIRKLFCRQSQKFDFQFNPDEVLEYSDFSKVHNAFIHHVVPNTCNVSNESQSQHIRLAQLSIITNEENESEFALLFSLSHVVGDGYTYYRLLNMISGSDDIVTMDVNREESASILKVLVCGNLRRIPWWFYNGTKKHLKCDLLFVSNDHVNKVKNEVKQKQKGHWVSTNDIICAELMKLTKPMFFRMATNLRGRTLDSCKSSTDLAGNFIGVTLFKNAKPCPRWIREQMQQEGWIGDNTYILDELRHLLKPYLATTNWSTFSKTFEINGCTECAHIPYVMNEANNIPKLYGMVRTVIFRYRGNKLGVLICSSDENVELFKNQSYLFL